VTTRSPLHAQKNARLIGWEKGKKQSKPMRTASWSSRAEKREGCAGMTPLPPFPSLAGRSHPRGEDSGRGGTGASPATAFTTLASQIGTQSALTIRASRRFVLETRGWTWCLQAGGQEREASGSQQLCCLGKTRAAGLGASWGSCCAGAFGTVRAGLLLITSWVL